MSINTAFKDTPREGKEKLIRCHLDAPVSYIKFSINKESLFLYSLFLVIRAKKKKKRIYRDVVRVKCLRLCVSVCFFFLLEMLSSQRLLLIITINAFVFPIASVTSCCLKLRYIYIDRAPPPFSTFLACI